MKKIILSVLFIVTVFGAAFSQDGRFSGGLELGLPVGNFSDIANIGFGASGRYEAPIQDKLNWTGTIGFLSFGGKSISGFSYGSSTIIPIQGGIKYYLTESFNGFYVGGELGFSIATFSVPSFNTGFGTVGGGSTSATRFSIAPGAGYHLGNLDFSARFQVVSDLNYFNIRAAYVLGGK
ncbi:MAG: hypothetical protein ACKVOQ_11055 [Cyclobacteriaceae bacterium]